MIFLIQEPSVLIPGRRTKLTTTIRFFQLAEPCINGDEQTLRYAAGRHEKLIAPFELTTAFSRQRFVQLLLMEGLPPAPATAP